MDRSRLEVQLVLHEGLRLKAYKCSEGYWTIGVGFNVQSRGLQTLEEAIGRKFAPGTRLQDLVITKEEALRAFRSDLDRFEIQVRRYLPEFDSLGDVRQRVVMDMAFNLGFRALNFKNCIAAIKRRDWSAAAREMYKSRWAHQVGDGEGGRFDRADRLAGMMLTGQDFTR